MKLRTLRVLRSLTLLVVILSFIVSVWAYYKIPETSIASHWNERGEVDAQMGKFWVLFLFPITVVALYVLFLAIPKIDPLRKNIKKFQSYYDLFILVLLGFFFYVQCLVVIWNLGVTYDTNLAMMPALSVLFYFLGILMSKAKRNWFIGIRTPWTLSNDYVWQKTHEVGSKWFKALSVYFVLLLLLESSLEEFPREGSVWALLVPVLGVAFGLVVYSYWLYPKEKRTS